MKYVGLLILTLIHLDLSSQSVWFNFSAGYQQSVISSYVSDFCLGQPASSNFDKENCSLTNGFLQPSSSPKILSQQSEYIICRGKNIKLSFKVRGGGTLKFQWLKNSTILPGFSDSIFTVEQAEYSDSGAYQCRVSNNVGSTITFPILVHVKSLPTVTLTDFTPTCSNAHAIALSNGNPSGGQFSGPGVQSGFFHPASLITGSYPLTYTYTDPSGCLSSLTKNILVRETTPTSIGNISDACINDDPILLVSGSPTGGFYEGSGVTGGLLYPILAGAGSHFVNYIFTDSNGCTDTAQTSILVKNVTPAVLNVFQDVCLNHSSFPLSGGSPAGGEYSGPGVSGNEFNPSLAGAGQHSIFYTYTNLEGCESYTSKKIRVLDLPLFSLGSDILLCEHHSVLLEGPGGYQKYEWSHKPDSNTSNIILPDTGFYSLRLTGTNGCNYTDSLEVKMFHPFEEEEICLVTVNRLGKNMVIWEKTAGKGTAFYNIYREGVNFGKYELLGTVPYDHLSIFTDTSANPRKRAYQYKISVVDTCGHESSKSYYHRTMLLKVGQVVGGTNLDWNARYEYEGGGFTFSKFFIYRGSSPDNLLVIDSIGPNYYTYTDDNPPLGKVYYQIGGLKARGCLPTGSLKSGENVQIVLSNFEDNGIVGIDSFEDNGLGIYPNPFHYEARVEFNNPSGQAFEAFIRDVTGKTMRTLGKITGNSFVIDKNDLVPGTYLLELRGKRILRGKLIIQ
ncbi:MAG: T9SS type A sorting domain-containing protein [Bacteroidales bacterium]